MLVCGSMCQYVVVCVVFVVLLVASMLPSMRWLLCGGDGSKKKDICNYRKMSRERIFHYGFKLIRKITTALKKQSIEFYIYFVKKNLHHVKSVII